MAQLNIHEAPTGLVLLLFQFRYSKRGKDEEETGPS